MRPFRLALVVSLTCASVSIAQDSASLRLVPKPRELSYVRQVPLRTGVTIEVGTSAADKFTAADLTEELKARGVQVVTARPTPPRTVRVLLLRTSGPTAKALLRRMKLTWSDTLGTEGYMIVPDSNRLAVIADSAQGLFYGVQTVKQLLAGNGATASLNFVSVRDWPAMKYRGLHDDLSRGPIPTLEYQKKQIRTFAAYKLNVYSPYYEHTLEFASNPMANVPGGYMTREQVRELIAYARNYHIDVIPEQEAFGHLHHVLKWELYAPLAETSHGHVIAPGQPGSMALIKQMFAEIDSLFPSRFIHLGADETFELGRGQTQDRVKAEGIGPVYVGFLKEIADSLKYTGKRLLFWGDVAMNHPELVKELPKDMIAVAWDYGLGPNWERLVTPFRLDVNMETWVAPGVSNWNRVYPNNFVALRNIQGFVREGQRWGATGVLNTSWDDDGDALFDQTWYGVLFGAAASWQKGESSIPDFEKSFGRVFHNDTTGKIDEAQRKLSAAQARLRDAGVGDASTFLFYLDPWSTEGQLLNARMLPAARDVRIMAESALVLIAQVRRSGQPLRELQALSSMELGARRIDWLAAHFQFADEIAGMYAKIVASDTTREGRSDAGRLFGDITSINGRIQDMREGYANLKQMYRDAWALENRPYWIDNVMARFDVPTQLWVQRQQVIAAAWREYNRTRKAPSAESIGVPPPFVPPPPVVRP
jgi:hexosaminidase